MSIAAADIFAIGWQGQLEDDTTNPTFNVGDVTRRFGVVNEIGAASGVEVVSANAGDTTQTVNVRGWTAAGILANAGAVTLNGTTAVGIAGSWLRVTYCDVSAITAGLITIRKAGAGTTLATIPSQDGTGARTAQRMFVFAFATSAGITRYDKMFWYNNHSTLAALSPVSRLTADPQTRIRIGVEPASGLGGDTANRVSAPGGISFVDDNVDQTGPANIPNSGGLWGIWFEFASTADDPNAPFGDSFTAQVTVQST